MHDVAHTPHTETHFESTAAVRDVVIGLSDGLTVPFALVTGAVVPLLPYIFITNPIEALKLSVIITLIALAVFGAIKGKLVGPGWLRSAAHTPLIEVAAATAAYLLARLLNNHS